MTKFKTTTVKWKDEEDAKLFAAAEIDNGGLVESGDDSDFDDLDAHSNLINDISKISKRKKMGPAPRNIRASAKEGGTEVDSLDILKRIGKEDLTNAAKKIETLPKPQEKVVLRRLKRAAGFEKVSEECEKWSSLVHKRRHEEQLSFPLQKPDIRIYNALKTEEIRMQTPLEQEVYSLLQGAKLMEDTKLTNAEMARKKAMSLEELKERSKLAWKQKEQKRRMEKKAWRENKNKSRKFHRLLRRDKLKKQKAELEQLEKTNPEFALEKLEELEKARVEERMTLRHKQSKWAHLQGFRATRDPKAMDALKENRDMHQELISKRKREESLSEDEEENIEEKLEALKKERQAAIEAGLFDPSNPWTASLMQQLPDRLKVTPESAIDESFVNFKKFWDEVNRRRLIERKAQLVAEAKKLEMEEENERESGEDDDESGKGMESDTEDNKGDTVEDNDVEGMDDSENRKEKQVDVDQKTRNIVNSKVNKKKKTEDFKNQEKKEGIIGTTDKSNKDGLGNEVVEEKVNVGKAKKGKLKKKVISSKTVKKSNIKDKENKKKKKIKKANNKNLENKDEEKDDNGKKDAEGENLNKLGSENSDKCGESEKIKNANKGGTVEDNDVEGMDDNENKKEKQIDVDQKTRKIVNCKVNKKKKMEAFKKKEKKEGIIETTDKSNKGLGNEEVEEKVNVGKAKKGKLKKKKKVISSKCVKKSNIKDKENKKKKKIKKANNKKLENEDNGKKDAEGENLNKLGSGNSDKCGESGKANKKQLKKRKGDDDDNSQQEENKDNKPKKGKKKKKNLPQKKASKETSNQQNTNKEEVENQNNQEMKDEETIIQNKEHEAEEMLDNDDLEEQLISIDNMFNQAELGLQKKLKKKLEKFGIGADADKEWTKVGPKKGKKKKNNSEKSKSVLPRIEEFDFTTKKNEENMDEGLARAKTLEDMDVLQNKTESGNPLQKASNTILASNKGQTTKPLKTDKKSEAPKVVQLDPSKFIEVDAKKLLTAMPDTITYGEEEMDGDDDDEAEDIIREAFADDYLVDEFKSDKDTAREQDKPKSICLALPGWGTWTGPNITLSKRCRNRFTIRAPKAPPRKDDTLGNVIYDEKADIHPNLRKVMVSELPFPFSSVKDFEASVRAPIGRLFVPEKQHQNLTAPPLVTKMGTVIEPMTEEELLKYDDEYNKKQKPWTKRRNNNKR